MNCFSYRDPNFNLTDFIKSLRLELKTWQKVFWRLWGICHVTVCSLCDQPFQVVKTVMTVLQQAAEWLRLKLCLQFYMLEFCSFHSGEAEFPNIQFKNSTLPMGEYPCCGEMALRFQPLFQVWGFPLCYSWNHLYRVQKGASIETIRSRWRIQRIQRCILLLWLTGNWILWRYTCSSSSTFRDLICISPKRKQCSLRILSDNSLASQGSPKSGTVSALFIYSPMFVRPIHCTSQYR